jgi:hypothetical protein
MLRDRLRTVAKILSRYVFPAKIRTEHLPNRNLEHYRYADRLCGLVVRVPGYRSRDPGLDSRRYQIFGEVVGVEPGLLSLVKIIEELLN